MNKLGIHIIQPTQAALSWAAKAPCVLALDDATPLYHTQAPTRIFRKYWHYEIMAEDGGAVAREVLSALGPAPATHIILDVERAQRLGGGLERHVEFHQEAAAHLRQVRPDLKLIGFNFSTGNPQMEDIDYLMAHNWGDVDVLGVHEYWGNQGFTPWHALRHRQIHEWTRGNHPPIIITECGRDNVEGCPGGWKLAGISAEQYAAELIAYDAEIAKDSYVLGATAYTCGAFDTPSQGPYNLDELVDLIPAWKGARPVNESDIEALAADIWQRGGAQFNPTVSYCQQWLDSFKAGGLDYWGAPQGGEMHRVCADGSEYVIQSFANKRLWWKVGEWTINQGPLPFN